MSFGKRLSAPNRVVQDFPVQFDPTVNRDTPSLLLWKSTPTLIDFVTAVCTAACNEILFSTRLFLFALENPAVFLYNIPIRPYDF